MRFAEHYSKSPPWLQPFGLLLRADGHVATVGMRPNVAGNLAAAYRLTLNGRCGVEGRAFPESPNREQLRKLWLDIFDAQFPE